MKQNEINTSPYKDYTDEAAKSAKATLFKNVYIWMTLALVITAVTALVVANSPGIISIIFSSKIVFYGLLLGELALVWILSANINRLSLSAATFMFIAYSILNGATMSVIFYLFTQSSIAITFFITAGTFGAMALYGTFTKKDLSSWGNILFMALIGLIIASIVNIFYANPILYWIVTYAGVIIFVGLTAYDTQKIKRLLNEHGNEVNETTQKIALMGALTLYLDFVNLFLYLLRIFGNRR